MGINQLLKILKSISKPRNISHYQNQTVAIDTYCWQTKQIIIFNNGTIRLHKALYSCAIDIIEGKKPDDLVNFCLRKIELMQKYNIRVVMVFDGGKLPMKKNIEDAREKNRMEKLSQGYKHKLEGDREKAMQRFAEAIDISPSLANYVLKNLRSRGIECIVAPYEADAQLAYLSIIGYVDLVITEDSDLLAFGAKRILYKLNKQGDGEEYALEYIPLCTDLNFTQWTSNMFLTQCILSGCDYLSQIPNVGAKTAYTQVNRLRDYRLIIDHFQRSNKLTVPVEYLDNFEKAFLTFRFQTVFCPKQRKLVSLNPIENPIKHEQNPQLQKQNDISMPQVIAEKSLIKKIHDISNGIVSRSFMGELFDNDIAQKVADGFLCPVTYSEFENDLDLSKVFHKKIQHIDLNPKFQNILDTEKEDILCDEFINDENISSENFSSEQQSDIFKPTIYGKDRNRQVFKLNKSGPSQIKIKIQELKQSSIKSYYKSEFNSQSENLNTQKPLVHEWLRQSQTHEQQPQFSKIRPFKTPKQIQDIDHHSKINLLDEPHDFQWNQSNNDIVLRGLNDLPLIIPQELLTQKFKYNAYGDIMAEKIKFEQKFKFDYLP